VSGGHCAAETGVSQSMSTGYREGPAQRLGSGTCEAEVPSGHTFSREATPRSFALLKFCERRSQVRDREIRPALFEKNKFGESAFPEQKVGEPLFTSRANQQINVG